MILTAVGIKVPSHKFTPLQLLQHPRRFTMPGLTEAKCILIIGATAGIGRALALAIHDLPSKPTVIIGGRRQERIDELCGRSERFRGVRVDVLGGREALRGFVEGVVGSYPEVGGGIYGVDVGMGGVLMRTVSSTR